MEWLVNNVQTAKAVLIAPSMINRYPAALLRDSSLGAVSFGLQFGGKKAEVTVLVMTQKGMEADRLNNLLSKSSQISIMDAIVSPILLQFLDSHFLCLP